MPGSVPLVPMMAEPPSRSPRLLVVAPNWLGDLVMITPLLTLLASFRGGSGASGAAFGAVDLAVRRCWSPLFVSDPRIDSVIPMARTGRHAGLMGLIAMTRDWRRGRYDAVLFGPPSLRVALAGRLAGIPLRVGYRGDGRDLLLAPALPRNQRGSVHYSDEMFALGVALMAELGYDLPAAPQPSLPALSGCDEIGAAELGPGPPAWALAPGATYGAAKTWPVARVAEFVTEAVGSDGVRLVLMGDAAGRDFADRLQTLVSVPWRREAAGPAGVVDLVGRTSLTDAVAWLRACRGFVGNDSGLMHMAAALGVATVGVFGSSSPAWTAPRGPRATAVTAEGFTCQPCYRPTCSEKQFCLDTVSGRQVVAQLRVLQADEVQGR